MVTRIIPNKRHLMTTAEVAARLGFTDPAAVAALIRAGKLKGYDVSTGRRRATCRIDPADVDTFLEGAAYVPPAPVLRRKRYASAAKVTEYF